MGSEVTPVLTDISGLSLGTDHIKPLSWRTAKCSKHPLTSHHTTFVQGLRIHFHRYCRQWKVEHLKYAFKNLILNSSSVLCLCHTLRHFLSILPQCRISLRLFLTLRKSGPIRHEMSLHSCQPVDAWEPERPVLKQQTTHRYTQDWWMTQALGPESCQMDNLGGYDLQLRKLHISSLRKLIY